MSYPIYPDCGLLVEDSSGKVLEDVDELVNLHIMLKPALLLKGLLFSPCNSSIPIHQSSLRQHQFNKQTYVSDLFLFRALIWVRTVSVHAGHTP